MNCSTYLTFSLYFVNHLIFFLNSQITQLWWGICFLPGAQCVHQLTSIQYPHFANTECIIRLQAFLSHITQDCLSVMVFYKSFGSTLGLFSNFLQNFIYANLLTHNYEDFGGNDQQPLIFTGRLDLQIPPYATLLRSYSEIDD